MAKVTVIPQKISSIPEERFNAYKKRRVAAYARVSTNSEEQATSFDAQVSYYTNLISKRPDWEFVKVYADEGITGTNTKKRENFNLMIKDALEGNIDLILTKSISRFARNTLDTLHFIRELKRKQIECYFEKENIWTLDPKNELVLTILASLAQEESRSISENVTWGKRVAFAEGRYSIPFKTFLGFKRGPNGEIEIDEEEAKVIKKIYTMFLVEGKTTGYIAEYLNEEKIPTPTGNIGSWSKQSVLSILRNEKYAGNALLQKKYVVDFLEHKSAVNNGALPQYFVENGHPGIIDVVMWEMVQNEIKRRFELGRSYSSTDIFGSKLICEECGKFYGRKIWHSNDKYTSIVYRCNNKFNKTKEKGICETPTLKEDVIKKAFIKAYNQVMSDKERILEDARTVKDKLTSISEIDSKLIELRNELEVIQEVVRKLIDDNARTPQSQEEYETKYNDLQTKFDNVSDRIEKLTNTRNEKISLANKMEYFIRLLEESDDAILEWDDSIWIRFVESAIVHKDKSITFKFFNGKEIKIATE